MPKVREWFRIKGHTPADTVENVSFLMLLVAATFVIVGVSVGTFIQGFPVALAIAGAFLAILGLFAYVVSELMRILSKPEEREQHG